MLEAKNNTLHFVRALAEGTVVRAWGIAMAAISLIPLAVIIKWERLRKKDYERKQAILRKYGNFVDKTDRLGTPRQGLTFTAVATTNEETEDGPVEDHSTIEQSTRGGKEEA